MFAFVASIDMHETKVPCPPFFAESGIIGDFPKTCSPNRERKAFCFLLVFHPSGALPAGVVGTSEPGPFITFAENYTVGRGYGRDTTRSA